MDAVGEANNICLLKPLLAAQLILIGITKRIAFLSHLAVLLIPVV